MPDRGLDPTSPLPRYYQIYSAFLERIRSGELEVGVALPPERQIAERYKVARLTVVKALDLLERDGLIERQHGRGTFVRERVQRAPRGRSIAFVSSPSITHDLMVGISQTAFEHGHHLQILGVDHEFEHLGAYLHASLESGVQGFLVYPRPGSGDLALYRELIGRGVPIVMVDRYFRQLGGDRVTYDNEEASFALTRRLLARGHRRVAVVPGFELDTTAVQDRLGGYRRALEEGGLDYDEELLWLDLYDVATPVGVIGAGYLERLRSRLATSRPTAVVTINDDIAANLIHDLLLLSRSPAGSEPAADEALDLELATFSDQPRIDHRYLNLVAVHSTMALGQASARLLIDRLSGAATGAARHRVVPMDIVELPSKLRRSAHAKEG